MIFSTFKINVKALKYEQWRIIMVNNTQSFEIISIEELKEIESNLDSNPFDTTGCGYISDDFTEEIRKQIAEAKNYYRLMDNN